MNIGDKKRMFDDCRKFAIRYVESSKDLVYLGLKGMEDYVKNKYVLIFLFEYLIKKMVEYDVLSFSHKNRGYSINVEIKPINDKVQKTKKCKLVPLYGGENFTTHN